MNRCQKIALPPRAAHALVGLGLAALLLPAAAQTIQRGMPTTAQRGELVVTNPPDVLLNGQVERLSPGARIRSADNMLVMSGAITGQRLPVRYLRDPHGLLHEVWILNPQEARERRPVDTPPRLPFFRGSTPPTDDGKTPYDQLPSFPKQ